MKKNWLDEFVEDAEWVKENNDFQLKDLEEDFEKKSAEEKLKGLYSNNKIEL